MELKNYQREIINDLRRYLEALIENESLVSAWQKYQNKNSPAYQDKISGVANICLKVPTGGGKTFLACAALKEIFDALPRENKFVVWLVPSEAILTQTVNNLSNPEHPYRRRINADFAHSVEIYTKDMMIHGQNFSKSKVENNLSIGVIIYDSLRVNSNKKDTRLIYQENGALASFDTDNARLIEVIRAMNPVVIVDESHNATSKLSLEMLREVNPSFILELTATPKKFSNIISEVTTRALKAEHMVKLPVIVYRSHDKENLISSAISLRKNLEAAALEDEKISGRYIRPIVLFQAQPNTTDDSETFSKIKQDLIASGIPENEIAIKTSNVNELAKIDLLSRDCSIRFIITINALKEGWDCPFAYILASLANKNSQTDVEQIVGRILRQPYAQDNSDKFLNAAYVLSCSEDFQHTVDSVVKGLNGMGIEASECIIGGDKDDLSKDAKQRIDDYDGENSGGGGNNVESFTINEDFAEDIANLKLPQFFQRISRNKKTEQDLFEGGEYTEQLLSPTNLLDGFKLSEQKIDISFDFQIAEVDIKSGDAAKYVLVSQEKLTRYQEYLDSKTPEKRLEIFAEQIFNELRRWRNKQHYFAQELKDYISRVLKNMTEAERSGINIQTLPAYIAQIKNAIERLEMAYRKKHFNDLISAGKIICKPHYTFKKFISLSNSISNIDKSLYAAEGDMNDFEQELIMKIAGLDNVRWWHRNIERRGFKLNGWLNHYPDFIVRTESGKIILIEAKGSHLDGDDSKDKLTLGRDWQARAEENYNYFMVFDNAPLEERNSYTLNKFLEVMSDL